MRILIQVCLLILLSVSADALPQEKLVVKGTLKKSFGKRAPKSIGTLEAMPFAVEVAKTNYNISLQNLGPNTPQFYYVVSDGADVYQCFIPLKKSGSEWLPDGSTLLGDIEEGVFPTHNPSTAVQILIFAVTKSEFYLASNNVLPLTYLNDSDYYSVSNLWQNIEYFQDGRVKSFEVFAPRTGFNKSLKYDFIFPSGYTNGYLVAKYLVKKYDAKHSLPLEFSYRSYKPKTDKSESSEDVDFEGELDYSIESIDTKNGNVSFAGLPENSFSFKLGSINDYRLTVNKDSSGFGIQPKDLVPFRSTEKFKLLALENERATAKAKKGVVVFVLLLSFLVPALAFLAFRSKRNQKQN